MAQTKLIYAVGAVVIVAATVWMARAPGPANVPDDNVVTALTPTANALSPATSELTQQPAVKAYQAYTDFQQQSRTFFDNAERLNEQERQAQLRHLLDGTNKYEQEGKLVPMEALVLKLAMLRYTTTSDDDYKARAKALIDQYKAQSNLREQAWLANPEPQFVEYKRQEQDIVREVMAMTVIPDGLSRDEYLRQRLERARIATMGAGATGP